MLHHIIYTCIVDLDRHTKIDISKQSFRIHFVKCRAMVYVYGKVPTPRPLTPPPHFNNHLLS